MGVLHLQDKWGSRFFIPKRFLPPKYNYHRTLPPAFGGGEVDRGQSRSHASVMEDPHHDSESSPLRGRDGDSVGDLETGQSPECAICYTSIDASLRDYMITPCDHIFHTGCLARWMEIKLECPTCRSSLPQA